MPRKRRWRKRSRSAPPATLNKANRPSKRRQWTEQQMLAAIMMAENGEVSANQAADVHGVPRSTLKGRLKGRVTHGKKPGPRPYLDSSEEEELVDYLFDAAKTGFGKTRRQIKCIAERRAFLGQTISRMGGGEGSWPDTQSLLFVVEIQLDMYAWMQ